MNLKTCKCCGRELPLKEFSRNAFGTLSTCKECVEKKRKATRNGHKTSVVVSKSYLDELSNLKSGDLSQFTPRQLMQELHNRGYEGELTYMKPVKIDISKLD